MADVPAESSDYFDPDVLAPASPTDCGPEKMDRMMRAPAGTEGRDRTEIPLGEIEGPDGERYEHALVIDRPTDCGPASEEDCKHDWASVCRLCGARRFSNFAAMKEWLTGPDDVADDPSQWDLMREQTPASEEDFADYKSAITIAAANEVARLQEQEKVWRRLLWLRHDASHAAGLYGDDGEMQCNMAGCMIDFLRDDPADIEQRWINASLARAALSTTEGEPND